MNVIARTLKLLFFNFLLHFVPLQMGQKDSREKTDDVSDPEILQSVEKAVRENTSLKTIRIDCVELSWTNITVAILKGLITNASLKDVELVVPRQFPAVLPVMVEEVREAKSKLRLVVRAGYSESLQATLLPLPFI